MAQYIDVSTAHGPVKFAYWVSTPGNGRKIDRSLPTILFLHSNFVASYVWREQFSHPQLRRFNLVGLDLLDHGWTQGEVPDTYTQEDAAADVAAFLDAANMPPVFLCAVSSGTTTAIQLAVSYPSKVSGMFLISPLGTEETEHAYTARREICEVWKEAMADPSGSIDEEALEHAVGGVFQLSLTGQVKPISLAMGMLSREQCLARWSHPRLREVELITCTYDISRHGYSTEELASLRNVPVMLVTGSGDFAYPQDYYEQFESQLKAANVPVETTVIDGAPHWMHLSHQDEVSALLPKFLLRHWQGGDSVVPPAADAGPGGHFATIFDDALNLKAFMAQYDDSDTE